MSKKQVIVPLVHGFEEIETVVPIDLLRRAGVEVVLAAIEEKFCVTGRCGITIKADTLLDNVRAEEFDMLLLPGGPGVSILRETKKVGELVRAFADAGKPIAAICAAPLVLHDCGLLKGRRFTAHFSTSPELPDALAGEHVVEDGNIITARGAGSVQEFAFALVRLLCGDAVAGVVAKAIMV